MRIDAYNAVNQVYQTTKDLAVAKKALSETSDIREERVAAIKKQMEEGTYKVSAEDVAEKILNSMTGSIF